MSLAKQLFPVPLVEGLDRKTDKKVLPPGKLFLLENARRRKNGLIQKRYGCKKLGDAVVGAATSLSNADALGTYGDELLQFTNQSVYAYSPSAARWVDKGAALSCRVRRKDLIRNNYEQTQVDQAITGNVALVAWEDSRGGIRCSIYDHETNTVLLSDTVVNASGSRPRCVSFGGNLFVFYIVSNDVRVRQINPTNPSPLGSEVTLSSNANSTNVHLDAIAQDNYMVVAFNGTGTNIYAHRVDQNLTILQTINIAESASNAIAVIRSTDSFNLFVWHDGTNLRRAIYTVAGASKVTPGDVEASISGVEAITGYLLPDQSGVRLYYQVDAAQTYNHYVKTAFIAFNGIVSGVGVFKRSVGLASKAFAYSADTTDRGFVGLVHESTLQSTFFVARNDGFVVAKVSPGFAGGLLSRSLCATTSEREAGKFSFAALIKKPVVTADNATFKSFKGVALVELDFTAQSNYNAEELDATLTIVGGIVSTYDGERVVESNFHIYPENASQSQGTGGSLTLTGTYQVCYLYQWTDAKGRVHRSAPSTPQTVTLTASNNRITHTIPTLRLTAKPDVEIVVFRTENSQTTFYRASSPSSLLFNDTTVDTINYVDDLSDATLITREPLYTNGGILENTAPPSAAYATVWKDRLVLAGTEDDTIWASKIHSEGNPVEFSSELVLVPPSAGGLVTQVASFADRLNIFKKSAIYYTIGDGPDDTGFGQWAPFERLTTDNGCLEASPIAELAEGLYFKGEKGRHLLASDGSVQYIGAEVEDWNENTDTAAVIVPAANEIRFPTLEGETLVYNYEFRQWSVNTDTAASDAVAWNGQYVYIRLMQDADSVVVKEEPDFFQDIDKFYSMRIGLGWMSLAGITGFQRVHALLLAGEFKSAHKLRVKLGFDLVESYTETHLWDANTYINASVYGVSSPYGGLSVYGGVRTPYIVRIQPARQKCTAVQLLIEDVEQDDTGESFNLSALGVLAGVKYGTAKFAAEASV